MLRQQPGKREKAGGWLALAALLRAYLRPCTGRISLIVVLLVAQAVASLYLPNLNADIINNGVIKGDTAYIWHASGLMLGLVVAVTALAIAAVYLSSQVSMAVGARLRAAVYRSVQSYTATEMSRFGIPTLVTRTINDVQQVQVFLQMFLSLLLMSMTMGAGAIGMAVREAPRLSILILVALALMAVMIAITLALLLPLLRRFQALTDRINQVMREQITGIRVIRAFVRTGYERDRFSDTNAEITRISLRANRILVLVQPAMTVLTSLSSVGVIWFGGHLVSEGSMTIGSMTAFLTYIQMGLVYAVINVVIIIALPRAVASAKRISEVTGTVAAVADPPEPAELDPAAVTGGVEFRDVNFGYPGSRRPVLSGLSFLLRPGKTSAIIGRTGSGKTTALNLISRFSAATDGAVLVNGIDVRCQAAERLWATIGVVPQTAYLFTGTVASNLRLGAPDATDEQLWHALDVAQALDFVAAMPGQLDATIDQGGTNVSGGQRQRLSIARALVRRPRLYLFDDCFSALDAGTDVRLRGALRKETRDATVLIVTQRVSTVMDADQIIVLDSGEIAGIGTHEELLSDCGEYREIVLSQLGEGAAA